MTTILRLDDFLRVSHHDTTKEMWESLQTIHERNNEVNRERFDTLTHEYELFRVKSEENISQMQNMIYP